MATLAELLKKREELDSEIDALRKQEKGEAKAKIRVMIETYGLTAQDVFPDLYPKGRGQREKILVKAKYRDPATGSTWTGRGKPPKWIEGKDRNQYLIP